jgi:hypothetical protein
MQFIAMKMRLRISNRTGGNFPGCAVAVRQVIFMQFIAMEMTCRISNSLINEQKAAASADARVR